MMYFNPNTTLQDLLDKGYGGLEALQILDMIKNNETVDDLVELGVASSTILDLKYKNGEDDKNARN